jgi:hypothetical protein
MSYVIVIPVNGDLRKAARLAMEIRTAYIPGVHLCPINVRGVDHSDARTASLGQCELWNSDRYLKDEPNNHDRDDGPWPWADDEGLTIEKLMQGKRILKRYSMGRPWLDDPYANFVDAFALAHKK